MSLTLRLIYIIFKHAVQSLLLRDASKWTFKQTTELCSHIERRYKTTFITAVVKRHASSLKRHDIAINTAVRCRKRKLTGGKYLPPACPCLTFYNQPFNNTDAQFYSFIFTGDLTCELLVRRGTHSYLWIGC